MCNVFVSISNEVMFNFMLLLGDGIYVFMIGGNFIYDSDGYMFDQLMVNGMLGWENQFSYGVIVLYDNGVGLGGSGGDVGIVYVGYCSFYVQFNGSIGVG